MKKRYIVLLSIIVVIILGIFVLPVIFKDDIRALIERKINEKLEATVYFDSEQFDISLLRHFPDLTVEMGDLGVVGKGAFIADTLVHIDQLALTLDIMTVIKGEKIEVLGVDLDKPRFSIKVLPDGTANYMIFPETEEVANEEGQNDLAIGINSWSIADGSFKYDDQSLAMQMKATGVNHQGSGDFAQEIFDMDTETSIASMDVIYEGIAYLSKNIVNAQMVMGIDLANSVYTFKENDVRLNDFGLSFDGSVAMPKEDIDINMTFASKENTFKSLLSLVPAIFTKDFADLETSGSMLLEGKVQGVYNETAMPGFRTELSIADGRFRYPSLPSEVKEVNASVIIDALDGDYDQMKVDISEFRLKMGNNPVKGRVQLQGLSKYTIDADIDAKVNLEELSSIYPIEGLMMKGMYELAVKAKGVYDEATNKMPQVNAKMSLKDGYIKSADYPIPAEDITFMAIASSQTGQMSDFKMDISQASLMMEGRPLKAKGHLENLENIKYDFDIDGEMDLGILEKVYPIEGTTLTGHVIAKVTTKGQMSDIEAEQYDKLPTSGQVSITDLAYADKDLPQGLKITKAQVDFTPQFIQLASYEGFLGESDLSMTGRISDYLAYVLKGQTVKGVLDITSKRFNSNEWMVNETGGDVEEESGSYGVVELPEDIDFKMTVAIGEVLYEKFIAKNAKGGLHLHDGTLEMQDITFDMYGGGFAISGLYDPRNLKEPKFNFSFGIRKLPFVEAYANFSSIKAMAPIAKHLTGLLSTNFNISGILDQELMPIPNSLTGVGQLLLTDTKFDGNPKVLAQLSKLADLSKLDDAGIQNFDAEVAITDGKIYVQPKQFQLGGFQTDLAGNAGVDGKLDFDMVLHVPGDKLPKSISGLTTNIFGPTDDIPMKFKIGGTYATPLVGLDKEAIKNQIKAALKAKGMEVAGGVKQDVKAEADSLKNAAKQDVKNEAKDQIGKVLGTQQDSTKQDSTKTSNTLDKIEESKKKLEEIKNKFPFGKKKKDGGN